MLYMLVNRSATVVFTATPPPRGWRARPRRGHAVADGLHPVRHGQRGEDGDEANVVLGAVCGGAQNNSIKDFSQRVIF